MSIADVLDRIAHDRQVTQPVAFDLTADAHRVLSEHGPFCEHWVDFGRRPGHKASQKPCLLAAGHPGDHDPRGGDPRSRIR